MPRLLRHKQIFHLQVFQQCAGHAEVQDQLAAVFHDQQHGSRGGVNLSAAGAYGIDFMSFHPGLIDGSTRYNLFSQFFPALQESFQLPGNRNQQTNLHFLTAHNIFSVFNVEKRRLSSDSLLYFRTYFCIAAISAARSSFRFSMPSPRSKRLNFTTSSSAPAALAISPIRPLMFLSGSLTKGCSSRHTSL